MKKFSLGVALALGISAPAFAQLGGLFQNAIQNAAKQAVQQGVEQGVQQGVTQAVVGSPAPAAQPVGPMMANGCYVNLPAMPTGVQFNADMNANGCVDQNEFVTYMQVHQSATASAAQRQPVAAPAAGSALGSVVGGAIAVKNAGGTGNAAAWVAGQNAIGAAAQAAQGQPQQVAANPADVNAVPAQGAQGAVSNATSEVVGGAVSGALKGLFGR